MAKVFRIRTKDPRSGEFRQVAVAAGSRDEAVAIVMAQEAKRVAYQLTPGREAEFGSLVDLEKGLREGTLEAPARSLLLAHHQDRPYVLDKTKEA